MLKIAIIGTVGIPASYGGFETAVENIIKYPGAKFTVYCSSRHYLLKIENFNGASLEYVPLKANGFSSILYDIYSIIHAIIKGQKNLLIFGVSGAIIFPFLRFFFPSLHLVTNIDGIEWKRDKWNKFKKLYLRFSEYLAVKFSSKVVTDNKAISEYVEKVYGKKSFVIPYGGDHAISEKNNHFVSNHTKKKYSFALALCRIEPENNVHMILEAFSELKTSLIFIGNWDASKYGADLKKKFKAFKNIELKDPIYDPKILFSLRNTCDVYIHGHSAGGTNPSLVEMMYFSKPIVAFDCIYNQMTMENHGYFFKNKEDLLKVLNKINNLEVDNNLLKVAKKNYSWKVIRTKYLELFD